MWHVGSAQLCLGAQVQAIIANVAFNATLMYHSTALEEPQVSTTTANHAATINTNGGTERWKCVCAGASVCGDGWVAD